MTADPSKAAAADAAVAPERSPDGPPAKRERYREIDVLRGFAALWVVLSNYLPFWTRYLGPAPILVPNEWGWFAVKLFFVISGIVIFMTIERCGSVKEFVLLRASRLYPAYWALACARGGAGRARLPQGDVASGNPVPRDDVPGVWSFCHFYKVYWSLIIGLGLYLMPALLVRAGQN